MIPGTAPRNATPLSAGLRTMDYVLLLLPWWWYRYEPIEDEL